MSENIKQTFHLPIKALSVNLCWQGRRFKTPAYKKYENDMWLMLPNDRKMPDGLYKVEIILFCKNWKRRDVDNIAKPILDILVKKGIIKDDSRIMELVLKKVAVDVSDFIEIKVEVY